jgi:hypothetical protein
VVLKTSLDFSLSGNEPDSCPHGSRAGSATPIRTADGALVVHGTGSEDFFNGGWYDVPDRWDGPVARALSGCME